MRGFAMLCALSATIAAAGCAGVDRINHVNYDGYSGADLAYAGVSGPIPVRVFGQPVPGADVDETAARIGDAMTGANLGPQVAYSVYDGTTPAGYTMVVRFGEGTPPRQICGDSVEAGVGSVYGAAFCKDGRALSYLAGDVGDPRTDGPGFRQAMAGAASQLLPIENPDYEDNDEDSVLPAG